MTKNIYRISIIIQEYDSEGFWNTFDFTHMVKNKKDLVGSLNKFYADALNYINDKID